MTKVLRPNFFKSIFSIGKVKRMNHEIDLVCKFLKNKHLIKFINNYNTIISAKNGQYFSSIGLNFKKGKLDSVKLYVHVLENLTIDEVLLLLPAADDYFKHINFKKKGTYLDNHHVGSVFEIKFRVGINDPSFGFFYILDNIQEGLEEFGYPLNLAKQLMSNCVNVGINYEYTIDSKLEKYKKYYYFNSAEDKRYFEIRTERSLPGEFIEYAEGDGFSKVNSFSSISNDFLEKNDIFNEQESQIIKKLIKKYDLKIIGAGFYEDFSKNAVYLRQNIFQNYSSNDLSVQFSDVLYAFR